MTQKKINVLFLSRAHGTHAGGMERLSTQLSLNLAKQPNFSVKVKAHSGPKVLAPAWVIAQAFQLVATGYKYDVIYLADPVLLLAGWVAKKIYRKKIVVTVHGLDITFPHPLYQLYIRAFSNVPDHVLAISRYVKELAVKRFTSTPITQITLAVQDNMYDPNIKRQQMYDIIKQKSAQTIVIYTNSRLTKRKGHAWFIQHVLPRLPKNVLYVISGQGNQKDAIKIAAKKVGVAKQVIMLGRISDAALSTLYNTADIVVQPNITVPNDPEGFGLVILEAALCKRPVVASHIEGLKDALINNENGIAAPAHDASAWVRIVQEIIKDPGARKKIGEKARSYTLSHYNWENTSAKVKEVILSLV